MLPPIAEVRATAEAYRDMFWPGLVLPTIQWAACPTADALYDAPSTRHTNGRIRLAKRRGRSWGWRMYLLHELVHAAVEPYVGETEYTDGRVPYHGPVFVSECNRVGALLGLPPVDPDDGCIWPMVLFGYELLVDE